MNLFDSNYVWQADNLPDGLSLNDGVISGTPTTKGVYTVPVTVSNSLGTCTKNITIKVKNRADVTIFKDGTEFEQITIPELIASIQEGSAQSRYNCISTQMLIPLLHPLTGAIIDDVALNFCSFRTVTLKDGSTKTGLILQFDKTLWKGFAPFGTNSFNRWKYSQLRKWLNASGSDWFTSSYTSDVLTPHEGSYTDAGVQGFLSCLPAALAETIVPVKVVTQAFFDDGNEDTAIDDPEYIDELDADITYDKVFIPSISEMAVSTGGNVNFPVAGFEGAAWDFYSNLNSGSQIAIDLNGESCSIITRSALLSGSSQILYVDSNLQASAGNIYNSDSAPAPAFVLG